MRVGVCASGVCLGVCECASGCGLKVVEYVSVRVLWA